MEPADLGKTLSAVLFCGLLGRDYVHESSPEFRGEPHAAIRRRKERVVFAHADIGTGMPFGAALTDDDVAGNDGLVAEALHAEAPACRVATVAGRTACLFVSHDALPRKLLNLLNPNRRQKPADRAMKLRDA
jgi:hypothetical protein